MHARTGLWERRVGNNPSPPGREGETRETKRNAALRLLFFFLPLFFSRCSSKRFGHRPKCFGDENRDGSTRPCFFAHPEAIREYRQEERRQCAVRKEARRDRRRTDKARKAKLKKR